jgi:hypothetical protein
VIALTYHSCAVMRGSSSVIALTFVLCDRTDLSLFIACAVIRAHLNVCSVLLSVILPQALMTVFLRILQGAREE